LLTGAAGYLGSHLQRLDNPGWAIRTWTRADGDLSQSGAAEAAVVGMDLVIHCAARVRDGRPDDYVRDNVTATGLLARAARQAGASRFVYLSSIAVHRPVGVDLYADSKREAEDVLQAVAGLSAVILRPGILWGGPLDTRLTSSLRRGLKRRSLVLPGRCDAPLPFSHVDNVADAIRLAADLADVDATEAFDITDGGTVSLRAFAEALADWEGLPRPRLHVPAGLLIRGLSVAERIRSRLAPSVAMPVRADTVRLVNEGMAVDLAPARARLGYAPLAREHLGPAAAGN
jgi:nucleoside-diphosphate-sugar epimerase